MKKKLSEKEITEMKNIKELCISLLHQDYCDARIDCGRCPLTTSKEIYCHSEYRKERAIKYLVEHYGTECVVEELI